MDTRSEMLIYINGIGIGVPATTSYYIRISREVQEWTRRTTETGDIDNEDIRWTFARLEDTALMGSLCRTHSRKIYLRWYW